MSGVLTVYLIINIAILIISLPIASLCLVLDYLKNRKEERKMNEKDKDYIIERDIKRGQLFKNFDDKPIYLKECLMCDNEIEIGQKYITNCNGDYFCSLECLLESYEVEEKVLNENDFDI